MKFKKLNKEGLKKAKEVFNKLLNKPIDPKLIENINKVVEEDNIEKKIIKYSDGSWIERYYIKGTRIYHREDGPAVIWYYKNGNIESEYYYINGKYHREDGPAIEWADGAEEWYLNDKAHREGGPARTTCNGSKEWYINDKLHREDGPAMVFSDGTKVWCLNDHHLKEWEYMMVTRKQTFMVSTLGIWYE